MSANIVSDRVIELPVTSDAQKSPTLPSRMYTDASVLELERELIFSREWLFVGHESELLAPGSYMTRRIYRENIVVVRNRTGSLRAFHNVCPHRGHELLKGSGKRNVIVCPYHAWAFDLEGDLKAVPGSESVEEYKTETNCLRGVRIESIEGFIFVNVDNNATSLAELVPGFAQGLREQLPNLDALEYIGDYSGVYQANWKIDVDNYLECYHCPSAHPTFRTIFEYENYVYDFYDHHIKIEAPARHGEKTAYPVLPDVHPKGLFFWYLWPNVVFNLFPGTSAISVMSFDPETTDSSNVLVKLYSTGEATAELEKSLELGNAVFMEDKALCESVQQGMHSKGFNQSTFVINEEKQNYSEKAVHYFHKRIWDTIEADSDGIQRVS